MLNYLKKVNLPKVLTEKLQSLENLITQDEIRTALTQQQGRVLGWIDLLLNITKLLRNN